MVDDGTVAERQQRLGCGERERTQTFAFASGHENRAHGEYRARHRRVDYPDHASRGIKHRDELKSAPAHFAQPAHRLLPLAQRAVTDMHCLSDRSVETYTAKQRPAHIAICECAAHVHVAVGHE